MEKQTTPFGLATKTLRDAVAELQALLEGRFATLGDLREAAARLEASETTFRPRYLLSLRGLDPEANQAAVDLLESSREAAHRASMRLNLAAK